MGTEEVKELRESVWRLSELVKILMLGHHTERKHKNIFKRMYRRIEKFTKRESLKIKNGN